MAQSLFRLAAIRPGGGLATFARDVARTWMRQAAERRERRCLAREFEDLADHDRARVLADAGLEPGELRALIAHAPASTDLMARMIGRLEVEARLRGDRAALGEVRRNCALCAAQRCCRRWLDRGADSAGYRAFCPNAGIFDRLRPRT